GDCGTWKWRPSAPTPWSPCAPRTWMWWSRLHRASSMSSTRSTWCRWWISRAWNSGPVQSACRSPCADCPKGRVSCAPSHPTCSSGAASNSRIGGRIELGSLRASPRADSADVALGLFGDLIGHALDRVGVRPLDHHAQLRLGATPAYQYAPV